MRIDDKVRFSPRYSFEHLARKVDWDNRDDLIEVFEDRVYGFYLNPAKILNESEHGFAAGVLCVSTIDFLARIETGRQHEVEDRFKQWLEERIPDFAEADPGPPNRTLAERFYKEFRNGLVHEGRIKNAGQFSYHYEELLQVEEYGVMIVNPDLLLDVIETAFDDYVREAKGDDLTFEGLKDALRRDFREDIEYLADQLGPAAKPLDERF